MPSEARHLAALFVRFPGKLARFLAWLGMTAFYSGA